jgi:hypothetical protein
VEPFADHRSIQTPSKSRIPSGVTTNPFTSGRLNVYRMS